MQKRIGKAVWKGTLKKGKGALELGSGAFDGAYSFSSRFEDGKGTNPEELIGAAHAGCFSQALALGLENAGYPPGEILTTAEVSLEKTEGGFAIPMIELSVEASVEGIGEDEFQKQADTAKRECPVSKALQGVNIKLNAVLK